MKITVTQQDIDEGERKSCTTCPVANAIKRQLRASRVLVDLYAADVSFTDPPRAYMKYALSDDVDPRIILFDGTGEMEPFEFEMEPIS